MPTRGAPLPPNGGTDAHHPLEKRNGRAGRERGTPAGRRGAGEAAAGVDGGEREREESPTSAVSRQGRPHGSSDGAGRASERARSHPPSLHLSHDRHARPCARTRPCVTAPRATRGAPPGGKIQEAGDGETPSRRRRRSLSLMILPQVHLRKPCYDFYFL